MDDLTTVDQYELVTDLAGRLEPAPLDVPAVCLVDRGTRRTHALIAGLLDSTDWHTVTADGAGDVKGHYYGRSRPARPRSTARS